MKLYEVGAAGFDIFQPKMSEHDERVLWILADDETQVHEAIKGYKATFVQDVSDMLDSEQINSCINFILPMQLRGLQATLQEFQTEFELVE